MLEEQVSKPTESEEIDLFDDDVESAETKEIEKTEETESTSTEEESKPTETTDEAIKDSKESEELFELKYNGQVAKKSKDELIQLAQKGMNYDKILTQLEQTKNSEENQLLDKLAKASGMNRKDYLQAVNRQLQEQDTKILINNLKEKYPNLTDDALKEMADGMQAKKKLEEVKMQEQRVHLEQEDKKAQQQKDIEAFFKAYPGVDAQKEFTQDMWKEVSQGLTLVEAYSKKLANDKQAEIEKLKQQLAAKEQIEKNMKGRIGTMKGEESDSNDPFIDALFD